jgi:hypothetical protein
MGWRFALHAPALLTRSCERCNIAARNKLGIGFSQQSPHFFYEKTNPSKSLVKFRHPVATSFPFRQQGWMVRPQVESNWRCRSFKVTNNNWDETMFAQFVMSMMIVFSLAGCEASGRIVLELSFIKNMINLGVF